MNSTGPDIAWRWLTTTFLEDLDTLPRHNSKHQPKEEHIVSGPWQRVSSRCSREWAPPVCLVCLRSSLFPLSLGPNFWQTTMWKVKGKFLLLPGSEHQWKTRKVEWWKQTSCCELMKLLENLICLPCPLAPTAWSLKSDDQRHCGFRIFFWSKMEQLLYLEKREEISQKKKNLSKTS